MKYRAIKDIVAGGKYFACKKGEICSVSLDGYLISDETDKIVGKLYTSRCDDNFNAIPGIPAIEKPKNTGGDLRDIQYIINEAIEENHIVGDCMHIEGSYGDIIALWTEELHETLLIDQEEDVTETYGDAVISINKHLSKAIKELTAIRDRLALECLKSDVYFSVCPVCGESEYEETSSKNARCVGCNCEYSHVEVV